jgi:hypothetical protein
MTSFDLRMKTRITVARVRDGNWPVPCPKRGGVRHVAELIRVWGFGRYRKAMVGIGRSEKISNDDFRFANARIARKHRTSKWGGHGHGKDRLGVEGRGYESTVDTWGAYLYFLFVNTVRMPRIYSSGIFIAVVRTGMFAKNKMELEGFRVK